MPTLKEINSRKSVIYVSHALMLYCGLQVLAVLMVYKQTEYQLITPLISESVICEVYGQYVDKGIVMAVALLLMMVAKFYRQHVVIVGIGAIAIGLQLFLGGLP